MRPVAFSETGPRNTIEGAVPGRPVAETIVAPGIFPCSWESGLVPVTGICVVSIRATVNGSLICSVALVTPVTTTAESSVSSFLRLKSTVWEPGVSATGLVEG